jgi:hypothetical protein
MDCNRAAESKATQAQQSDLSGLRLAIYENQRPEVNREFAGRIDTNN